MKENDAKRVLEFEQQHHGHHQHHHHSLFGGHHQHHQQQQQHPVEKFTHVNNDDTNSTVASATNYKPITITVVLNIRIH